MPIFEVQIGSGRLIFTNLHNSIVFLREVEMVARVAYNKCVTQIISVWLFDFSFGAHEKVRPFVTNPAPKLPQLFLYSPSKTGDTLDRPHRTFACALYGNDLDIRNKGFCKSNAVEILS